MTKVAEFAVFKGERFQGMVKAVNHQHAVARAHGRYGICDVELATERKPLRKERLNANKLQQAKQSRLYPVGDFEARRKALIEEVLG